MDNHNALTIVNYIIAVREVLYCDNEEYEQLCEDLKELIDNQDAVMKIIQLDIWNPFNDAYNSYSSRQLQFIFSHLAKYCLNPFSPYHDHANFCRVWLTNEVEDDGTPTDLEATKYNFLSVCHQLNIKQQDPEYDLWLRKAFFVTRHMNGEAAWDLIRETNFHAYVLWMDYFNLILQLKGVQ